MNQSGPNDFNLSDLLNTGLHMGFVALAGLISSLLNNATAGQLFDPLTLQITAEVAILVGLMVFIKRYTQNNQK